jgi:hypothetical protein
MEYNQDLIYKYWEEEARITPIFALMKHGEFPTSLNYQSNPSEELLIAQNRVKELEAEVRRLHKVIKTLADKNLKLDPSAKFKFISYGDDITNS